MRPSCQTSLRLSFLAALVVIFVSLPAADASAVSCKKNGYKVLDQSKYVTLEKGPIPNNDSTSDFGYYACRVKNGKRFVLGGNECFGNNLGQIGNYAFAGNFIAYEARTCGDPEGESDAKVLNLATGVKIRYQAEQGFLPGGGVQDFSITDIVVRPNGNVAWIAFAQHLSGGNATRYDVRRVIDQNVTRIDSGTTIVPDSLALSGTHLYWLDAETPETSELP